MVLGVLPALDATRCLLSVEAPAAAGPSLLSLNPIEVSFGPEIVHWTLGPPQQAPAGQIGSSVAR